MKLYRFVVALAIVLFPFSAKADLFNFSYTFGSGAVASGSLIGTQNGNFVESVSNVSVFYDGVALAGNGSLYQPYNFAAGCCFVNGPPVISFNANLNNFIFSDGPPVYPYGATNWFSMDGADIDNSNFGTHAPLRTASIYSSSSHFSRDASVFADNGILAVEGQGPFDAGRWSLTSVTPVPEPETYAMLLAGLGLLGLAARRRKAKEAATA